jgi:hypothetical protein
LIKRRVSPLVVAWAIMFSIMRSRRSGRGRSTGGQL